MTMSWIKNDDYDIGIVGAICKYQTEMITTEMNR